MAEHNDDVEKSVQELEKEITCAVCHEHFTEPKVLPCCHYYCKQCIHHLAVRIGLDKPFSCPECRADTILPMGEVDDLQPAFFINRMQAVYSKLELAHGKVEAKCEICAEDKAEAFCRQCAQFICAECVKSHKRMKKAFPGHKISTLEELREGGAKGIVVQESTLQICQLHDEPMKIYCCDCSCLICRDCTIIDHRDHNCKFVKVAAPEISRKISQQLAPLRERSASFSRNLETINATKRNIESQGQSVASLIENSFAEFQRILEDRKCKVLAEASEKVARKLGSLSNQEKDMLTAQGLIQSVIEFTEQYLEHSADDEIMATHAQIQSRIDREIEEQSKKKRDVSLAEEADIGVDVISIEELKKFSHTVAQLTLLPIDPLKCVIISQDINHAVAHMKSEIMLSVFLSDGKPTKRECEVKCYLRHATTGLFSTFEYEVTKIEANNYSIQYTPTARGRHKLSITVGGKEITGSPFPVFVSIPLTQLDKPVRNIACTDPPIGLDFTSREILITHCKGIMIFNKGTLREVKRMSKADLEMETVFGVCVDRHGSGCIYVTGVETGDSGKGKIVKLSSDFEYVSHVVADKKRKYWNVAVAGEEVLACDKSDCIMVYTKDLEFARKINFAVRDISVDPRSGNLFVSSPERSCIQVLNLNGELIRSFACDNNNICVLKSPHGVCIFDDNVFITDWTSNSVSVFTTSGDYITMFRKQGTQSTVSKRPCGQEICFGSRV